MPYDRNEAHRKYMKNYMRKLRSSAGCSDCDVKNVYNACAGKAGGKRCPMDVKKDDDYTNVAGFEAEGYSVKSTWDQIYELQRLDVLDQRVVMKLMGKFDNPHERLNDVLERILDGDIRERMFASAPDYVTVRISYNTQKRLQRLRVKSKDSIDQVMARLLDEHDERSPAAARVTTSHG